MVKERRKPKPRVGQGKGGGPKTDTGKGNSSKNSTKHGLCSSKAMILPDENAEEHAEVQRGWREEYQPEGHAENTLVDEVISSEWGLRRAKRRVMAAEEAAVESWTEESQHHLELMQRYKTAAERSFYRALNAVQSFRKDRLRMWEKEKKIDEKLDRLTSEIEKLRKQSEPIAGTFDIAKPNPNGPFGTSASQRKDAEKTPGQRLFGGEPYPRTASESTMQAEQLRRVET